MHLYALTAGQATNLANRLGRRFKRETVYITVVQSGDHYGQYVISPDRLSDKSMLCNVEL
jgi:hypothetical protein